MEKKRLGRGLDDIADIFISQKTENPPPEESTSENVREAVGKSYPGHSFEESEGNMSFSEDDIITVIDKRLKVTGNCLETERPFEYDLSERADDFQTKKIESSPEDSTGVCEITEHVISQKKIEFLNSPDVQQNIIKLLSQHLRQNYNIKNIELVKVNKTTQPGMKNLVEENILIYIKKEENH